MNLTNMVLISPSQDNTLIEGLQIANIYDVGKNVAVTGIVKVAPTNLVCNHAEFKRIDALPKNVHTILDVKQTTSNSMDWETLNEVEAGDFVVFKYLNLIGEVNNTEGGVLMPYQDLYCKIKDDIVTPLNGHVFFKADFNKSDVQGLREQKQNIAVGTITHVGTPNTAYMYDNGHIPHVKVGDRCFFDANQVTMLESPAHEKLFGQSLWAIQPIDIIGLI